MNQQTSQSRGSFFAWFLRPSKKGKITTETKQMIILETMGTSWEDPRETWSLDQMRVFRAEAWGVDPLLKGITSSR